MLALGLFYRRHELASRVRRSGVGKFLRRTGLVAGTILGNVYTVPNDLARVYVRTRKSEQILVANLPSSIFMFAIVGSLVGVAVAAIASMRCRRFES